MSDYFPRPVLINLLSRLPVKTLLQFRCVCKSWCSLISTPDFITTHLKFNLNPTSPSQTHHRHELLRYFSLNPRREHYSLRLDDEPFTELIDLHCPFKPRSNNHFKLVGSFHGLIVSPTIALATPTLSSDSLVLLFDMGSEVFCEMRLPKKLVSEFPLDLSVAVYGNSISVFHYDNRDPCTSRDCEVWIMKGL